MSYSTQRQRIYIDTPSKYRIIVQGYLEEVWSDRLADMQITMSMPGENEPVTTLVGQVRDQAELVGVLNGLYELRMPILSMEIINEDQ